MNRIYRHNKKVNGESGGRFLIEPLFFIAFIGMIVFTSFLTYLFILKRAAKGIVNH